MEQINYATKDYPEMPGTYKVCEGTHYRLNSPEAVARLADRIFRDLDFQREHFIMFSLDSKNRIKSADIVSIGCLNANIVHPREVFYIAIANRAAAIIVIHNHPSGDPAPSQNDVDITRKLFDTGRLVGINVFDHIIVGDSPDRFFSLKEHNLV